MEGWLKAGYAIARTDYEGLGTPGVHPYLIGTSAAHSVLDAARAARALDKNVSNKVIIAGHSQGGHAALWAAALAPSYTRDLDVRGTVASRRRRSSSSDAAAQRAHAAGRPQRPGGDDPARRPGAGPSLGIDLLGCSSTRAAPAVPADPTQVPVGPWTSPARSVSPRPSWCDRGPTSPPCSPTSSATTPTRLSIKTPVHVEQGEADTTVFPHVHAEHGLDAAGQRRPDRREAYPGVDHGGVVTAAKADAAAWIKSRLR